MMVALKEETFYLEGRLTDNIDQVLNMVFRVSQECFWVRRKHGKIRIVGFTIEKTCVFFLSEERIAQLTRKMRYDKDLPTIVVDHPLYQRSSSAYHSASASPTAFHICGLEYSIKVASHEISKYTQ